MRSKLRRILRRAKAAVRGAGSAQRPAADASPQGAGAWSVQAENRLPGTDAWKLKNPGPDRAIEGYADKVAVDSGESFQLLVSTTADGFTASAYRMGHYANKRGRLVWSSGRVAGKLQAEAELLPEFNTVVAPWSPSLTVDTKGWPEGCYLIRLVSDEGYDRWVPMTVRSQSTAGKVVLVNAVTTWLAYNRWGGGWNIYGGPGGSVEDYEGRSRKVSLDRPYDKNGSYFNWYELPMLALAERIGVPLAYGTDYDLDSRYEWLKDARALVFAGHDEYWTSGMMNNATRLRDAGVNLAFFGANTAYRHVRLEPSTLGLGDDRVMVCFKQAAEDPFLETNPDECTQQWRNEPNPRPESALIGVQYEGKNIDVDFVVVESDAWMFKDTGAVDGSSYGRLVRVEYDKLFTDVPVPRPIQILSDSPLVCGGAASFSNSCYYTVPSGAGVFSSGTLGWSSALPGGGYTAQNPLETAVFTRKVTENILRAFAEGPAALKYPARDNYEKYARPKPASMTYTWEQ